MQTIVIDIADPVSDDQPAIDAAIACRPANTDVALFHNVYHQSIIDQSDGGDQVLAEMRELLLNSRRSQLETLASKRFGADATTRIVWAEQGWQELIRFSSDSNAAMVATQTNHRNRWQRLTLSNDDWETIRHCPLPLLLARADVGQRYQRVIAAVDPLHIDDKPASLDQAIVNQSHAIAKAHSAELKVVNVVVPTQLAPMGGIESAMAVAEVSDHVIESHKAAAQQLIVKAGCSSAETLVTVGHPEKEIVELANAAKGSLVVMGGVSRSRLQRLLIGSTAERVLDHLSGDVLIIKPQGFGDGLPAVNALLHASMPPL